MLPTSSSPSILECARALSESTRFGAKEAIFRSSRSAALRSLLRPAGSGLAGRIRCLFLSRFRTQPRPLDLRSQKAACDRPAVALRTSAIGIASAYRDYEQDAVAWSNTFDKHYAKASNQAHMAGLPGGSHGDAAVQWFVDLMAPIKAPPGFSNHSNGLAVDFSTTESGVTYGAYTNRHAEWRRTWLVANASSYRFNPLASEEWHWDFR